MGDKAVATYNEGNVSIKDRFPPSVGSGPHHVSSGSVLKWGWDALSFTDQGCDVKELGLILFRIKHDDRWNWEERLMMKDNKI